MITLPPEFIEQIEIALGDRAPAFFEALTAPPPVSYLVNARKSQFVHDINDRPIPWCPYGYYLDKRPEFILDPAFHAGKYYVMEASSMMLWQAMTTLLDPNMDLRILDLCGAPGGKAMVASNFIGDNSLLVINEVHRSRFQVLKENVAKWGMSNVYLSNYDPSNIGLDNFFDCVIVDAPCSGEGMFRKTNEAMSLWSRSAVNHCSLRQKRILNEAARLVRPGGILLYSTCTFNGDENINNTKYISDNQEFKSIRLNLQFNVIETNIGESYGYQCYPHLIEGEGFYLSALRKASDRMTSGKSIRNFKKGRPQIVSKRETQTWMQYLNNPERFTFSVTDAGMYYAIPNDTLDTYGAVLQELPYGSPSLLLGKIKGKDTVPHHNLALSNEVNQDIPRIELTKEQAISYLRKDVVTGVKGDATGWHLASFQGLALGWLKQTRQHLKNYYPTNLRIRKR